MGEKKHNRLGSLSLLAAVLGFLIVEFQPWLALSSVRLFGALTLKSLLEAFFEASLAGAFADWFAVTALFKDPLGIPLPHTNVIAKNKDSIAAAVPRFLTGFVSPKAIAEELGKLDYIIMATELLTAGEVREELRSFLRLRASEFLAAYGGGDEAKSTALRRFSDGILDFVSSRVDAPAGAAALLAWARKERFDHKAIEAFAEYARAEIGRNRVKLVSVLTPMIKRNSGWQGIFIGTGTVERFLAGAQDELAEIKADKSNEIRLFILSSISAYSAKLNSAASSVAPDAVAEREKLANAFSEALASEEFRKTFSGFLSQLLARVGEDLAKPNGELIPSIELFEEGLVARLSGDASLRARLNAIVANLLCGVIERGRLVEEVTEYLAGLLRSTDERHFVARIEESVWNDLQYIRVNGAVVGGLVGLAIALAKAALGG